MAEEEKEKLRKNEVKETFEDVAQEFFGCLVQWFMLFVLVAALLAYAFSSKFRGMTTPVKFFTCISVWTLLTAGFYWLKKNVRRSK